MSTLDLTNLQTVLTTIANGTGSVDDMVTQTYNAIFGDLGLSADLSTQISGLLTLMDQFGDNNGQLTANDFTVFSTTVKSNPLILVSFLSALSTQGIALYNDTKSAGTMPSMSQETVADFVFRLVVFVVVVPVLKTQSGSSNYFVQNVSTIFDLLNALYVAYNTFVTGGGFTEIYNWLKVKFNLLRSCCAPKPANAQSPATIAERTSRHVLTVSLAVHNRKLLTENTLWRNGGGLGSSGPSPIVLNCNN